MREGGVFMRYYWLIVIALFIGCSGVDPSIPERGGQNQNSPWVGSTRSVVNDGMGSYYKYNCAPSTVKTLWDEIYSIMGDKQYQVVSGGGVGEVDVILNPFGIKMIDGMPFNYQYGFLVETSHDGTNGVYARAILTLVEPLGSFANRIRINHAGVVDTNSWLGMSSRYLWKHPVTHYQFKNAMTNCAVNLGEAHGSFNVQGVNLDNLIVWAAWFYPTYYRASSDEIDGFVRIQYTYVPTGGKFVQIWKVKLAIAPD